ncbi:MAG: fimbria/pilus outer membrane usher protein, partial [Thermoanaerobaculia bacterium]
MKLASLVAGLLCIPLSAFGSVKRAILPLRVNSVEQGEVSALLDGVDVLLPLAELERAGLGAIEGARCEVGGESFVSLASLSPDVSFTLDESDLTLRMKVRPRLLKSSIHDLRNGRPTGIVYTKDTSAFLNYAATLNTSGSATGFGEAGVSLNGNLLYGSVARRADGSFIRGLTNFTIDDRGRLNRWVLGDTFVQGGGLSGSAFLAGISVSKDFGLDPYFYRYPGMGVTGAVLTPTRAEIYVNGALVKTQDLAPGTFDLTNLPVQSGNGATRVVLRDAFGQERVLASPYYLSTRLLAPGLSQYSYNVGLVREDVAGSSFRYGRLAFLGTHRLGLSSNVTGALHAEAANGLISGGPTLAASLGVGELELSAAGSRDAGSAGWSASVAYAYLARPFGVGVLVRAMSDRYANVSLSSSADRPT